MSEYRGPKVNTYGRINANQMNGLNRDFSRDDLAHSQYDGQRDLYEVLGYDETRDLTFQHFWNRYQRQGIATALLDRFVESTWQEFPSVIDDASEIGDDLRNDSAGFEPSTEFEEDVSQLISGESFRESYGTSLRESFKDSVILADKLASLGEYSLLFFGFSGSDDESLESSIDEGQFSGLDDLAYTSAIDQKQVKGFDEQNNEMNPRYGLPETYDIEFDNSGSSTTVHHSRVIHIPEGTRRDSIRGTPTYLKGWNRFDDIAKLLGGSAEMAWRGAYMGMVAQPPRDQDGEIMTFSDEGDGIEEQVEEFRHNLRRVISTTGEVETLEPSFSDVSNTVTMQFQALSAAYDIPQSILMGNETGERATQEDRNEWSETIASRRDRLGVDKILRPTFDRLRYAGVLPDPTGGDYSFNWTPLTELSDTEWVEMLRHKADAIRTLSSSNPSKLFAKGELRKILGYNPKKGSFVDGDYSDSFKEVLDPAEQIDEEMLENFESGV